MKHRYAISNIYLFCLFIFCASYTATAQSWKWGRGPKGRQVEGYLVATDTAANVYAAGYGTGFAGSVNFGTITIPSGSSGSQTIIVKYDSSGNILWVKTVA